MKNILFTFLLLPSMIYAQQQKSLDECIRLAWKQNPGFRNNVIRVKEVRLNYIASLGSFLPRVGVSAETGRRYTAEPFDEGSVGLDMTLSLFEGFSRLNRVRFERLNFQQSKWELKDSQNELAYRVMDTYCKLLLEGRMLTLAREQNVLSERYLKQTEAFVELGLRSMSDLQEVRARREGDVYRCQSRENSYQLALLQLKHLLNMQECDTLIVQDTITYETIPLFLVPQTESLYQQSLRVMPSYRVLELQQIALRKQYSMAVGKFSPTVFARFAMSSCYSGEYMGIGISVPLLSGLERVTALRKQKLAISRWTNEEEQAKQQLYTEVEQTILSLRAGCNEHQQALLQVNAEKLVLKESERKWEEGLISVFQLMEARNRFISAKAELVRVRLQLEMNIRLEKYYRTGYFIEDV